MLISLCKLIDLEEVAEMICEVETKILFFLMTFFFFMAYLKSVWNFDCCLIHFLRRLIKIKKKLKIFEDALFQCSKTSTHKMEKLAHWKNSIRKAKNGKSRNWAIFDKLALNHIHIDLLFPRFIFLYSSNSTLWYDFASGYHRSELRLDLTPQMIDLIA